jgi:hypothetical protein
MVGLSEKSIGNWSVGGHAALMHTWQAHCFVSHVFAGARVAVRISGASVANADTGEN